MDRSAEDSIQNDRLCASSRGAALTGSEFRRLGAYLVDELGAWIDRRKQGPPRPPVPDAVIDAIRYSKMPWEGAAPADVIEFMVEKVIPYPLGNGHPGFLGWMGSSGAPIGALAELVATLLNPIVFREAQVAVELELTVLGWIKQLIRFPVESGGLLTSGGSSANLYALASMVAHVCKRNGLADHERSLLIVYFSEDTHFSVSRALKLLGIPMANIRRLAVDGCGALVAEAFRERLREDDKAGMIPACLCLNLGTATRGAIDPFPELMEFAKQKDIWVHVDGSYGAPAVMIDEIARLARGWDGADSISVDPHKWLFVPFGCGCVFVRHIEAMRSAFAFDSAYFPAAVGMADFPSLGVETAREFRALKAWAVMSVFGTEGYVREIENCLLLARTFAAGIRKLAGFEVLSDGPLSIVCFRAVFASEDHGTDDLNRKLLADIEQDGRLFLSGTIIAGRFSLRACFVSFHVSIQHLRTFLEVLRELRKRLVIRHGLPEQRLA